MAALNISEGPASTFVLQQKEVEGREESIYFDGRNSTKRRSLTADEWQKPSKPVCNYVPKDEVMSNLDDKYKSLLIFIFQDQPTINFINIDPVSIQNKKQFLCTIIIDGSETKHAPYLCDRDYEGCDITKENLKFQKTNPPHYFKISANPKNLVLPYCSCQMAFVDNGRLTKLYVKQARAVASEFVRGGKLDILEYTLLGPRPLVREMLPRPKQLLYTPPGNMTKGTSACEAATAIKSLVAGRLDMLAVAMKLIGKTTLCPAIGARLVRIRVSPLDLKSCFSGQMTCPILGVVMTVFPFPWNSLNVRELGMEKGGVEEAGFYLPLPLHVTQFMRPKEKYRVTQEVMRVLTRVEPGNDAILETASEHASVVTPDLKNCVVQLEMLQYNRGDNNQHHHCPPALSCSEHSALSCENLQFSVKGVAFAIGLHFKKEMIPTPTWISYDGLFIEHVTSYLSVRKRVSLVKPDVFIYVPYDIKIISVAPTLAVIDILQWGRLLSSTLITEVNASDISSIQFGMPGLCGNNQLAKERLVEHREGLSTKIRVSLANCRTAGKCVEYLTDGVHFKTKPKVEPEKPVRPNWLLNVRPHWSWTQAVAVYKNQKTVRFSEEVSNDFPGDVTLDLSKDRLKMTIVGRTKQMTSESQASTEHPKYDVPMPERELPFFKELKLYSRVVQLGYSSAFPGDTRFARQIATFIYASYDQLTFEVGIADLGTPFFRSSRGPRRSLFEDGLSMEALDFWNGQNVHLLTVATVPEPTVLRYVTGTPCLLEDVELSPPSDGQQPVCNQNTPPCIFCDPNLNKYISQCLERVKCSAKHRTWESLPARPTWPECTDDPNCAPSPFIHAENKVSCYASQLLIRVVFTFSSRIFR